MGATQSKTEPHILKTRKGDLKGIQQTDLADKPVLRRYARIPYARPPTGVLRWRRPQALPIDFSFSNNDYTSFGPVCPQPEYGHGAAVLDNPDCAPEIENTQSDDCLYLNIWVPANTPPAPGWPVQVFIHGGWLQVGDANQTNSYDPFDLLAHSTPRIIVAPTYRLNIFGFLAGKELQEAEPNDPMPGNYGLWDQRAAIEWVHANIDMFGGNPNLITVGGLSAGAHSAFMQLYYDTYQPTSKRFIKQAYLWSNAPAIQPNPTLSVVLTNQWHELTEVLGCKSSQTPAEKLVTLRNIPSDQIIAAISKLKMHTFRTSTDGDFVPHNFLQTIHNGSFTALLAQHGVRIILGEVSDEALLYKLVNPPSTYDGLVTQVQNYYPKHVTETLLSLTDMYDIPGRDETGTEERFQDVFARIVADMQVHVPVRGLTRCLLEPRNEAKETPEVLRYRIAWRAKSLDAYVAPEVGVCHAADNPIWWLSGIRAEFKDGDRKTVDEFLRPFGDFLEGKPWMSGAGRGADGARRIGRYLDENGQTHEDVEDKLWDRAMKIWDAVAEVQGVGR